MDRGAHLIARSFRVAFSASDPLSRLRDRGGDRVSRTSPYAETVERYVLYSTTDITPDRQAVIKPSRADNNACGGVSMIF
jgi:hypothetical protein